MRYVAKRDHSLKEFSQKLRRFYTKEEVQVAIEWIKQQSWQLSAEQLSERTKKRLHEKHKGIHAINAYLQKRGLPIQQSSHEIELEKALALIERKYPTTQWTHEQKTKAARFLTSRGFSSDVIGGTLSKLKNHQTEEES